MLSSIQKPYPVVFHPLFAGRVDKSKPPLEIGVYLGSFNPIHNGHLRLATQAKQQFNLHAVEIVALAKPTHKKTDFMSDADRQYINELAVKNHPGLVASSLDMDAKRPTLDDMVKKYQDEGKAKLKLVLKRTLKLLDGVKRKYEKATGRPVHLNYIVGIDGLAGYPQAWNEPEYAKFIKQCKLLIAPRPGSVSIQDTVAKLKAIYPKLQHDILNIIPTPLSSTDIRNDMQNGIDITSASVPDEVAKHLNQNRDRLLPKKAAGGQVA